jgi:hypothetical protein
MTATNAPSAMVVLLAGRLISELTSRKLINLSDHFTNPCFRASTAPWIFIFTTPGCSMKTTAFVELYVEQAPKGTHQEFQFQNEPVCTSPARL